ncbi:alanine--tRNA ligase [Pseudothermotoga thermarum]|uniref:Alanine--tRNA ligase n=1 Tax=Pseudothermotoga thermarum DSM 5069 TaxID=688269 RepID=F7YVZ6_9THEM|nr:alanine--tRNA ligase [Pseudothermotoga thermarum]AEH51828.1 alanyl-tRNA synthetase [Pseudothermotoga thermarum DSM 5069]
MTGNEIRKQFLAFFESKGHKVLPSASLIPDDPQLLFTVAGMVPFKPIFWGKVEPVYTRVATCQKCLRTNDIENVGRTPRHHTFFEMLGNFSFGDYFKKEAILWAWEFVTKVLKLPEEKLWVTIYKDDDEAFMIWRDLVGVPEKKIIRMGKDTNFWGPAGPTGPCGPCSEIHYDTGAADERGEEESTPATDDKRFLEIWNLVFTEFYQDEEGKLHPLPKKNIDTGAGLERVTAVVQGVSSNFETDLFAPIMSRIEEISGVKYKQDPQKDISMRVIADHSRAVSFLIADGVFPSNEERGYVLRRILRRAVRHGVLLGLEKTFLYLVNDAVIEAMKDVYPELAERRQLILEVTKAEEERFFKTIVQGSELLKEIIAKSKDVISGEDLFRLYDTYGFPPDIVIDVAKEKGLKVDLEGFEKLMQAQRERAREARGEVAYAKKTVFEDLAKTIQTKFLGYEKFECQAKVVAMDPPVASEEQKAEVVFDQTVFYAEKGGQVSDTGVIVWQDGQAEVEYVYVPVEGVVSHVVTVKKGTLKPDLVCTLKIDVERRLDTMRNHTATHLLHAALRKVLGTHVRQFGSLVAPDRLRFDFTHYQALKEEELQQVENLVNEAIMNAIPVIVEEKPFKEAVAEGAIALFGEKYGEFVRVVKVPNFSEELCGGTHVSNTGNIGLFKIVSESAISAGVRRIEAVTGRKALEYLRSKEFVVKELTKILGCSEQEILQRVSQILEKQQELSKQLEQLKEKLLSMQVKALVGEKILNIELFHTVFQNVEPNTLRNLSDVAIGGKSNSIVALFSTDGEKVNCVIRVSSDLTSRVKAGELAKIVAATLGGGGGGRPDMAQAGGKDLSKIAEAVKALKEYLTKMQG